MSNKTYDILKWIAQIVIPALATLYYSLGTIWNLPKVTEVVGTMTAIDTFLGCLLGISTLNYEEKKKQELEEAKRLNGQLPEVDNTDK